MGRTKQGTPPTYRKHKPTGQAIVTIDGRDIYLGAYDSPASKAQYARLIAEHAVNGCIARQANEVDGIRIKEVMQKYRNATGFTRRAFPAEEPECRAVTCYRLKRILATIRYFQPTYPQFYDL